MTGSDALSYWTMKTQIETPIIRVFLNRLATHGRVSYDDAYDIYRGLMGDDAYLANTIIPTVIGTLREDGIIAVTWKPGNKLEVIDELWLTDFGKAQLKSN